jgi:hypothetical protein
LIILSLPCKHEGFCYENGNGVTKDLVEAVRWYTLAADQKDPVAQFNLGKWRRCVETGSWFLVTPTVAAVFVFNRHLLRK